MSKQYLLPDGRAIDMPDNYTLSQADAEAAQRFPEAFGIPQKHGFVEAAKAAANHFGGESLRGLGELTGSQGMTDYGNTMLKPDQTPGAYHEISPEELAQAKEKGLWATIKARATQGAEMAGGMAGEFAVPTLAGMGAVALAPEAAVAGISAKALAEIVGFAGAQEGATVGANKTEREQVAEKTGQPVGDAPSFAYSLIQSGIMPFASKLAGGAMKMMGALGPDAGKLADKVAKGDITHEEALAQMQSKTRRYLNSTGENAVAGTTMMVGGDAMQMNQAGEDLGSDEAKARFKSDAATALVGAPLFGLLGVPGRGRQIDAAGKSWSDAEAMAQDQGGSRQDVANAEVAQYMADNTLTKQDLNTAGVPNKGITADKLRPLTDVAVDAPEMAAAHEHLNDLLTTEPDKQPKWLQKRMKDAPEETVAKLTALRDKLAPKKAPIENPAAPKAPEPVAAPEMPDMHPTAAWDKALEEPVDPVVEAAHVAAAPAVKADNQKLTQWVDSIVQSKREQDTIKYRLGLLSEILNDPKVEDKVAEFKSVTKDTPVTQEEQWMIGRHADVMKAFELKQHDQLHLFGENAKPNELPVAEEVASSGVADRTAEEAGARGRQKKLEISVLRKDTDNAKDSAAEQPAADRGSDASPVQEPAARPEPESEPAGVAPVEPDAAHSDVAEKPVNDPVKPKMTAESLIAGVAKARALAEAEAAKLTPEHILSERAHEYSDLDDRVQSGDESAMAEMEAFQKSLTNTELKKVERAAANLKLDHERETERSNTKTDENGNDIDPQEARDQGLEYGTAPYQFRESASHSAWQDPDWEGHQAALEHAHTVGDAVDVALGRMAKEDPRRAGLEALAGNESVRIAHMHLSGLDETAKDRNGNDVPVFGEHDPVNRAVILHKGAGLDSLVHEVTHAALHSELKTDKQFKMDMTHLMALAYDKAGTLDRNDYGFKDVHEFLSEAYSNPKFRAKLDGMKIGGKSATDKLKDLLKKALNAILGRKGVSVDARKSILDDVMQSSVDRMKKNSDAAEKYRFEGVHNDAKVTGAQPRKADKPIEKSFSKFIPNDHTVMLEHADGEREVKSRATMRDAERRFNVLDALKECLGA